ncbi:E3 ubiquitin-protein ligase RNF31 [Larimichthys crocea]|uniref:Uncharacterized protein n=1 Tax=Larimichthys crocea TaxID=215358 RepID=A0ACD3QRS8_LARCR|nr:E3 ubiquitin-protein ligase RNF31 [Larimichthys crocea]
MTSFTATRPEPITREIKSIKPNQKPAASAGFPPFTLSAPRASRGCVGNVTCFSTLTPTAKDTTEPISHQLKHPVRLCRPGSASHCTTVNEMRAVLCATCERPRLATAASNVQESLMSVPTSPNTEWQCKSCTVVNQGSSILCEVCERPRLATRPPVAPVLSSPGSLSDSGTKWMCQFCTYVNTKPGSRCVRCATCQVKTLPPEFLCPCPSSRLRPAPKINRSRSRGPNQSRDSTRI